MTPLRTRLRESTRLAHDRVDAAFGRHDLTSRQGYTAFLRQQASALLPVEAALDWAHVDRLISDWPARRRSSALLQDLGRLGAPVPEGLAPPDLDHPAEALGALYVVEGSRLGARLLLREAEKSDDDGMREAMAFLGHGAGSPLWSSFVAQLERSPYAEQAPDRVVAGALLTFAMFERTAGVEAEAGARG